MSFVKCAYKRLRNTYASTHIHKYALYWRIAHTDKLAGDHCLPTYCFAWPAVACAGVAGVDIISACGSCLAAMQ